MGSSDHRKSRGRLGLRFLFPLVSPFRCLSPLFTHFSSTPPFYSPFFAPCGCVRSFYTIFLDTAWGCFGARKMVRCRFHLFKQLFRETDRKHMIQYFFRETILRNLSHFWERFRMILWKNRIFFQTNPPQKKQIVT